jgi:hypothetical protein
MPIIIRVAADVLVQVTEAQRAQMSLKHDVASC